MIALGGSTEMRAPGRCVHFQSVHRLGCLRSISRNGLFALEVRRRDIRI